MCVFVIWEKAYQLVSHAHAGRTSFRLLLQIISSHHSISALQLDGFINPTLVHFNEQPEHIFCFTVDLNICVFMPKCKNIWCERTKSLFKWVSLWKQLASVGKCDVYKKNMNVSFFTILNNVFLNSKCKVAETCQKFKNEKKVVSFFYESFKYLNM